MKSEYVMTGVTEAPQTISPRLFACHAVQQIYVSVLTSAGGCFLRRAKYIIARDLLWQWGNTGKQLSLSKQRWDLHMPNKKYNTAQKQKSNNLIRYCQFITYNCWKSCNCWLEMLGYLLILVPAQFQTMLLCAHLVIRVILIKIDIREVMQG